MGILDRIHNAVKNVQNRQRGLRNSTAGRAVRALSDWINGSGSRYNALDRLRDLEDEQTREDLRSLERGGIGASNKDVLAESLKKLGPVGHTLISMINGNASKTLDQRYYDLAKQYIEAAGGRVVDGQSSISDVRAARDLIDMVEAQQLEQSQPKRAKFVPDPIPQVGNQPNDGWSKEIFSPQSSNVYSIQYHFVSSTLYVTYKANEINSSAVTVYRDKGQMTSGAGDLGRTNTGGKKNEPGAKYAYFDVPARIWEKFERASSKGKTVWDELRQRGSMWGHKFRYRLVGAMVATGDNGKMFSYVPRKATKNGFKARTLAQYGTGKRAFANATLPEENFSRGRPNRGRGSLNRGR